jgi:hypothetical protein
MVSAIGEMVMKISPVRFSVYGVTSSGKQSVTIFGFKNQAPSMVNRITLELTIIMPVKNPGLSVGVLLT